MKIDLDEIHLVFLDISFLSQTGKVIVCIIVYLETKEEDELKRNVVIWVCVLQMEATFVDVCFLIITKG